MITISLAINGAKPNHHPDNLFNLLSLLWHCCQKVPLGLSKPKFVAVAETSSLTMFRNTQGGKQRQPG